MIKKTLFMIIILALLFSAISCKSKAKLEMAQFWAGGALKISSQESWLYVLIEFYNDLPGVEVTLEKWSIKIFQDNDLILELNETNVDTFEYKVSKFFQYYITGDGVFKVGIPDFSVNNFVTGNIFKQKTPNQAEFTGQFRDIGGTQHTLQETVTFNFYPSEN